MLKLGQGDVDDITILDSGNIVNFPKVQAITADKADWCTTLTTINSVRLQGELTGIPFFIDFGF